MTRKPTAWLKELAPEKGLERQIKMTAVEEVAKDWEEPIIPLYTKGAWVGLTDEEILAVNMSTVTKLIDEPIVCDTDHNIIQLGKAIEAKLKEKNGI